tara:strand:- start:349 stop:504 length:156 start_codon:yes stop_codon:yes gene_type:complete
VLLLQQDTAQPVQKLAVVDIQASQEVMLEWVEVVVVEVGVAVLVVLVVVDI